MSREREKREGSHKKKKSEDGDADRILYINLFHLTKENKFIIVVLKIGKQRYY